MPEIKQDIRVATLVVTTNDSLHKNMADYVCDGTDDHVEIQAAIDALPATGGRVILLDGTFNVNKGTGVGDNCIYIDADDITMEGQGAATKLVMGNNQDSNVIGIAAGHSNIIIHKLDIDGNRDNNVDTGAHDTCCIRAYGIVNLEVSSCYLHDAVVCGLLAQATMSRATNNLVEHCASAGIEFTGDYGNIVAFNTLRCTVDDRDGVHAIEINTSEYCSIIGNTIENATASGGWQDGILIWTGAGFCSVVGNTFHNMRRYGFHLMNEGNLLAGNTLRLCTDNLIEPNASRSLIFSNQFISHGLTVAAGNIRYSVIRDNFFEYGATITDNSDERITIYEQRTNQFLDVLAELTNHCGSWVGTGAQQEIVAGITQPDIPRNLTVTCTNNAAPSGDVVIEGVDAKGNSVSEAITILPGGTRVGNEAFATISKITIPATVDGGSLDTVDVGIGSKLGLSNVIYATGYVYKVTRNAADYPSASYTVNVTYHTVDMSPGAGIVGGDDYTVWYKSNLNVIE